MMANFPVNTVESAPEEGKPAIQAAKAAFGFAPNLIGVLATAPPAAQAYLELSKLFGRTTLTPIEQQAVLIAASVENGCDYCIAAHSTAAKAVRTPAPVLTALRDAKPLSDPRLEALRRFTIDVVRLRGRVHGEPLDRFLAAGFSTENVLEVILGVTMKTLSNYANHVADTPVDAAFL